MGPLLVGRVRYFAAAAVAVAGLVVRARLGAQHAPHARLPIRSLLEVAEEDQVHHPEDDLPGLVRERWDDARHLPRPRLQLLVLRVRNEEEPVGEERELVQY